MLLAQHSLEERKIFVKQVLDRVLYFHNAKTRNDIEPLYELKHGTLNNWAVNGSVSKVLDLAYCASQKLELDINLFLCEQETEIEELQKIEEALFEAFDAEMLTIKYQDIKPVAKLIANKQRAKLIALAS